VTDNIIANEESGQNSNAISSLIDGMIASLSDLNSTDYVCFNIGNSSLKLFSDHQAKMQSW